MPEVVVGESITVTSAETLHPGRHGARAGDLEQALPQHGGSANNGLIERKIGTCNSEELERCDADELVGDCLKLNGLRHQGLCFNSAEIQEEKGPEGE